jgi:transcriptional regulator
MTEKDIVRVFRLRKAGFKVKEIARWFGVTRDRITKILGGHAWKHVKREFHD